VVPPAGHLVCLLRRACDRGPHGVTAADLCGETRGPTDHGVPLEEVGACRVALVCLLWASAANLMTWHCMFGISRALLLLGSCVLFLACRRCVLLPAGRTRAYVLYRA